MSALVSFTDKSLFICQLKNISFRGKACAVKYTDNRKYAARVIAICNCEMVLEQLKLHLEGKAQYVEDSWRSTEILELTYKEASERAIQNNEETSLFIDVHILPQTGTNIRSFTLKQTVPSSKFFTERSQFTILEKETLKSGITFGEQSPVTPTPSHDAKKINEKFCPPDVRHKEELTAEKKDQSGLLATNSNDDAKKKDEVVQEKLNSNESIRTLTDTNYNNNASIMTSKVPQNSNSGESFIDETNGSTEFHYNPILSNTIINDTAPQLSNDEFNLPDLTSLGKPRWNSTMKESPVDKLSQQKEEGQLKLSNSFPENVITTKTPSVKMKKNSGQTTVDLNEIYAFPTSSSDNCQNDGEKTYKITNTAGENSCSDQEERTNEELLKQNSAFFQNKTAPSNEVLMNSPDCLLNSTNNVQNKNDIVTEVTKQKVQTGIKRKIEQQVKPKVIENESVNLILKELNKDFIIKDNCSDSRTGKSLNISYNIRHENKNNFNLNEKSGGDSESEFVNSEPKKKKIKVIVPPDVSDDDDDDYKPGAEESESTDEEYESDGEEYYPTDPETTVYEDGENCLMENDEKILAGQKDEKKNNSLHTTHWEDPRASAPDDRELEVDLTSSSGKDHACLYCGKTQKKIARHLQLKHSNEDRVKAFTIFPPHNKERQSLIAALRKEGDHRYNTDKQLNKGQLIVCRRPNKSNVKSAADYVPCGNCRGQYSRSVIRHHWRKCTNISGKSERIILVNSKRVGARIHQRASRDVRRKVFPYFHEDEVVRAIRYDELVILYANKQCEKYSSQQHLYVMIRARCRLIGRFLLAVKEINHEIKNCMDVFHSTRYDSAIEAVRVVAGFCYVTNTFRAPAVASSLGTLLKHLGEVLECEYIKRDDNTNQTKVINFLKLLNDDYGVSINRAVTETQTQQHRRKEVVLPSIDDIKKLYSYIDRERSEFFCQLSAEFSYDTWKKLAETTLLSLQIFNRRRPGEIERLCIEDFESYRGINDMADKEIYKTLTAEGKKLAEKYVRFQIRGKRNRVVPVLVDGNVLKSMKLILKHRKDANVPEGNLYFFGLPSINKDRHRYLKACNLLREYSIKCGAKIPSTLRGTELRKHIATRCIALNLQGNEITDLANFMGHHENIHKDIYRQPVAATDIVKISKILNIVQGSDDHEDCSEDEETEQSTSKSYSYNEPTISKEDSIYAPGPSTSSARGQYSRTSVNSDCSTPRRTWTDAQRSTVLAAFGQLLIKGIVPSGAEMQKLINNNDCLQGRTVAQLRTWLHIQKKQMSK